MELWLKGTNGNLRFPVLPSEYQVTSTQKNTIVNVINIGEVILKGKKGLREISFSSFFPSRYDSSYCEFSNISTPKSYVDRIEKMKNGSAKLVITGTSLNFRCVIEQFEWGESDGTGDIYFKITLREYKAPSTSISSVVIDG